MPLRVDERRSVGRPRKVDARRYRFEVRLSEEEMTLLDELHRDTGMNISNIMRAALATYATMRKQKWSKIE